MIQTHSFFHGSLVRLAAPRSEDIEVMAAWGENAEYLRNVDTDIAFIKTKEEFADEGKSRSNGAYFRLRTLEEDKLVGFVVIHSIEWNNRAGKLAIGIGETEHRSKGYGTDALALILRYAFHELNLDRVELNVISYNTRAIRAYERAGFVHEGRLRSAVYRDGKRYDLLVMGILREEWATTQPR